MNKEAIIKPLIILLIVIIGSTILIRSFSGGQTLSEYAIENNIPAHADNAEDGENK
ncbi:MAG: hypothetical protein Q4D29_04785 [Lachnospiraceae bacterium]|nr:hypothetical protein [Lachnospiraceae bacterium]